MRLASLCGALGVALMLNLCCAHANQGGIRLNQTRVIFSGGDSAQNLTVENSGSRTWLIQTQIASTDDASKGAPVPFIVTPPLFSLKGDSRQLLRILPQGHSLPADRESLFYLSVSAIPSQDEPLADRGRLSVGMRFVLKLFYRPQGLSAPHDDTACRLAIRRDDKGVSVTNPTPYFQTLGVLSLDGKAVDLTQQPAMVAPHSNLSLTSPGRATRASWQTITDYGGLSSRCQQTL